MSPFGSQYGLQYAGYEPYGSYPVLQPALSSVSVNNVFVVGKDIIKANFTSEVATTPGLFSVDSYSVDPISDGVEVEVRDVLLTEEPTVSSVFIVVSKPTMDQLYKLTIRLGAIYDPNGTPLAELTATWKHVRTKVDSVLDSFPLMYGTADGTRNRSQIRTILEAISISDEEIGGSF